eukprot:162884_1
MSQWQFHSSWKQAGHQRPQANHNKMSGRSISNPDPFAPRPKVERTPVVLGTNLNRLNDQTVMRNMIGQSPAISSYFIPNTPCYKYKQSTQPQQLTPTLKQVQEEPGSTQSTGILHSNSRARKRRRSSTTSQPEGTFSPIPRSKFISELNESLNRGNQAYAQTPVSIQSAPCIMDRGDEKSVSPNLNTSFVSSELKRRIRSEVLAEIEEMEHQITKEMNDEYLLLNPSPSSLLSQMSKLEIKTPARLNANNASLRDLNPKIPTSLKPAQYVKQQPRVSGKRIIMRYCCNKNVFLNLFNFVCIMIILTLYWNVVDFQWS